MTYRKLYHEGIEKLKAAQIVECDLDALLLLEHTCNTTRQELLLDGDRELNQDEIRQYRNYIQRRSERIPLQHITGVSHFYGLEFKVNQHVLIPRHDTECLVELVLNHVKEGDSILDMCTGSGCILLSILAHRKGCTGLGVDISPKALEVASENRDNLGLFEADFKQGDLFERVEGKYDIIVSNPPYIATNVIDSLEVEVKCHEPMNALDGYEDGLYFYRKIIQESANYLKEEGYLFFEIGYDQAEAVQEEMMQAGYVGIEVRKDLAGLDRIVYGRIKKEV